MNTDHLLALCSERLFTYDIAAVRSKFTKYRLVVSFECSHIIYWPVGERRHLLCSQYPRERELYLLVRLKPKAGRVIIQQQLTLRLLKCTTLAR